MRVLVVTTMYPTPALPWYGRYVAEQVRSLQDLGLSVDVLFLNSRRSRFVYAWGPVAAGRAMSRGGYDVIHAHHTYSLLFTDLARLMHRKHLPIVLTSHEGEVLDRNGRTRTWHPTSRLRHYLPLKRLAASRADHVIFVNRGIAAVVGAVHADVIPCGVDMEKFRPLDRDECRAQLGIALSPPVVFFPARRDGHGKRLALANEAFNLVRSEYPQAIFITGGNLPHHQMPLYYGAADVVLQASYYEASPTVVKEALACEVPVISTEAGDTQEVIASVENCAVCGDDAGELAQAMIRSFGKRAVGARNALRLRGLGLDQVARRVADVYTKVAG